MARPLLRGRITWVAAFAPALVTVITLTLSLSLSLSLTGVPVAAATAAQAATITTAKPFGPVPGTFEATGAFTDSGTFANTRFALGALGAPTFVSIHVTEVFHGTQGNFTLRADIKETVTQDPLVLVDSGTRAFIDGTGADKTLRGRGTVTGTADEHSDVISRTYTGTVRFG
ncbi:hypothetical protein RCH23_002807 [Cryobacterium sp. CAN_C3]|uniref:hypothetical protein n=1 Tax=unclassified Cryobacterium TaxID=2649013 RepID=UPI0018C9C6EF|nr:hypothetical protein [Cryobacterium sp. CAN_C3]MEC5155411.1 hypothetical protein [Cryobacterium sp. CAN_C3]